MREIGKSVASAVVLASGVVVAAPTLVASAAYSDCTTARVCLFQNKDGGGEKLAERKAGGGQIDATANYNDRTSSWWNNTTTGARWWQEAKGGGFCVPMPKGAKDSYVSGDRFNDKLSSWATNGSTCG